MDPNKCWKDLLAAQESGDIETVQECAGALTEWMNRKGFAPTVAFGDFKQIFSMAIRSLEP